MPNRVNRIDERRILINFLTEINGGQNGLMRKIDTETLVDDYLKKIHNGN
jgi:hypothetical protein